MTLTFSRRTLLTFISPDIRLKTVNIFPITSLKIISENNAKHKSFFRPCTKCKDGDVFSRFCLPTGGTETVRKVVPPSDWKDQVGRMSQKGLVRKRVHLKSLSNVLYVTPTQLRPGLEPMPISLRSVVIYVHVNIEKYS